MSVRWIRSAKTRPNKLPQAIGWSKEISAFVEKKFDMPKVTVHMQAFGDAGILTWTVDYDSMADLERVLGTMLQDSEYWGHINKAIDDGLFFEDRTHDRVYKLL